MPDIFELIQQLCPDGVEYGEIQDVSETVSPKGKIKSKDYLDCGKYPVIDQGQNYIGGYTNEEVVFPDGEYVIFGDHTCVVKFADFRFAQGADGVKVISAKKGVLTKFLYYCMDNIHMIADYSRHWSKVKKMSIPVPPLAVQQEIVRILDAFDTYCNDMTSGLAGELAMRRKQFQYWQEKLLSFDDNVPRKALGDVAVLERGKPVAKQSVGEGTVPVIAGGQQPAYYCAEPNRDGSVITVAGSGAYAGFVSYWDEPIFVSDAFSIVGKDEINTKFLYYYLKLYQRVIYGYKTIGGIPHVHISHVDKMSIPIPSLAVQQEIVRIFDVFVELERELERELELRAKQFEYYRDHLLAFHEKKGA